MSIKIAVLAGLSCVISYPTLAGDAVAIGYDHDGVWAALTYNRSSTPRGGPHYHDAVKACAFAVRDLYARSTVDLAKAEILGQSDRTGYVAVAQGKSIPRNKDLTAIGRGKSQSEADEKALKKLNDREATTDEQIVYRYFSYGADSGARSRAKQKSTRRNNTAGASQSNQKKT